MSEITAEAARTPEASTSQHALELRGVTVAVDDTDICRDIDLTLPHGQSHVLFGPNGSGKSTLLAAIMGLPPYTVRSGDILYDGERINDLAINERAELGIGMSFQRPPSLAGVTVRQFTEAIEAGQRVSEAEEALDFRGFLDRDVNAGFSGGEIKRWEILKLFLQQPDLCLFDEPESGVDIEHMSAVGLAINELVTTSGRGGVPRSALLITHTGFILDYVPAARGHLMIDGRIVGSGDAMEMFASIRAHGYRATSS